MASIPKLIMDEDHNISIPTVNIVPSTGSHIAALKLNLRPKDSVEVIGFGVSIQHALWYSYRHSLTRKTALIDRIVSACWGVHGTFLGSVGYPWLLTSPEVERISPLKFVRIYQEEVLQMLKLFKRLENYVHEDYSSAIRLLEIIGFTVEDPQKMGNAMYRKFWMEA